MKKFIRLGLAVVLPILIMADAVLFFAGHPLPRWVMPLLVGLMMTSLSITTWIDDRKKKESARRTTIVIGMFAAGLLSFFDVFLFFFYPHGFPQLTVFVHHLKQFVPVPPGQ